MNEGQALVSEAKLQIEALLFAADQPLSVERLEKLLEMQVSRDDIRKSLLELQQSYDQSALQLVQVASGFRLQIRPRFSDTVSRLWQEKPPRFSRALLETLALIAYRQPVTRGEIEDIRGVSVSSNIIKTLEERGWVKVIGHKEVPGKPALFGTTKEFLDYFNLKTLAQLPTLSELKSLEQIHPELALEQEENFVPDETTASAGAETETGNVVQPED